MHELSITRSVVRTVTEATGEHRVLVVRMRIGVLSGVVPDALRFAWDVAVLDGPLADSRLEIDEVPAAVTCRDCGLTSDLTDPLPLMCPECGRREVDLVRGREIEVVNADIDDGFPATEAAA
ncbi:MAG: hydrogenase maturation nickel metallochaperone HypA [Kineosporiaceae bacterium]